MPLIHFSVRYRGGIPGAPGFTTREWNNLLKECWYEVGMYWFMEMRPKHFTKAGGEEYGYAKRTGEQGGRFWSSYQGQKQKKFGHTRPLVYSGDLEKACNQAGIFATNKGVRVTLPGAGKANWPGWKRRDGTTIDKHAELTTVSAREEETLCRLFEDCVERRLAAVGDTGQVST